MQTTVMTPAHSVQTHPIPPALPAAAKAFRRSSLESLLKDRPALRPATEPEVVAEPGPGIFMGLRIALFFNAGLGLLGLLAYETWTMLAR